MRIRDELRMSIAAYQVCPSGILNYVWWDVFRNGFGLQTLYESSIAFGMRKALMAEHGKADMDLRIEQLESENVGLQRESAEWRMKSESIEKREAERREQEAKKHKEEVQYLENYGQSNSYTLFVLALKWCLGARN